MSRCAIYCPDDRKFYGGLDLGWTKQLRLAKVHSDEKTAMRAIRDWRKHEDAPRYRLVWIHWRILNRDGRRVCDRGSIKECRELLEKYALSGKYDGWSQGPYRIMRVATLPNSDGVNK